MFTCERYIRNKGSIVIIGKFGKDSIPIIIVNVYSRSEDKDKREM